MPIKGLSDRGLSFPEIGQVRKGSPKNKKGYIGKDLTYFRVEFDERERKAEATFREIYGEQPQFIRILLPFDEIERMWDPYLEAYTAGRMVARSDGETIVYQVDTDTGEVIVKGGINLETGRPKPHPESDIAGTDYKGKPVPFKPVGRLKVIIPELARAAYLTVMTTSKHDIANISDQLRAFKELNGGRISGIPLILRRRPKEISVPMDDGQRTRMTKWMLSIEADPEWVRRKLQEVKHLALPGNGLELLPQGDIDEEPIEGEIVDDADEEEDDEEVPATAEDETESEVDGPTVFWSFVKQRKDIDEDEAKAVLKECKDDFAKALKVLKKNHTVPEGQLL